MSTSEHLTQKQLAARWNKSEACLKKRRRDGEGPDYIKLGKSPQAPILYPLSSILEYEESHMVRCPGARR